jgi:hypothetical protein
VEFIEDEQMPRNSTEKILHRVLREKYNITSGKIRDKTLEE